MVALLVFIIATLEIVLGQKKTVACKKVHFMLLKIRLDIDTFIRK